MNKRGLFKVVLSAAMAMALSGAAYADDVLAKVKAAGVLKVGTETEFAPFDYIDAGAHVEPRTPGCTGTPAHHVRR